MSASGNVALSEIRPEQCRAARGLIDWTRDELAKRSGVTKRTILRFEDGSPSVRPATISAIRSALEAAGVTFTNGDEPGVKLKRQPD